MVKLVMDSGKEYGIENVDLNLLFDDEKLASGEIVKVLKDELVRIPTTNVLIRPSHISSLEELTLK